MTIVTETTPPGTGHHGQEFLVGDHIYLRTVELGDEKYATSWRPSIYPISPELTKKWIEDDLPKAGKNKTGYLQIVRKSDDVIVGSLRNKMGDIGVRIEPHVDPLYGDDGQRWMAEAIILNVTWLMDECYRPATIVNLPATQSITIDALLAFGMFESARFRKSRFIDGERVDNVALQRLHPDWIATMGDPTAIELDRSRWAEPQALPKPAQPGDTPPKNAMMIGERVYLRPEEKDDIAVWMKAQREEEEPDIIDYLHGRELSNHNAELDYTMSMMDDDLPDGAWFAVCLRENDQIIGAVGVDGINWIDLHGETGAFFMRTEYRSKGFGTEAKALLLDYAFDTLGLHSVQSYIFVENVRSQSAIRKQGYREAGLYCWGHYGPAGFSSMVLFDLHATEWRALRNG